MKILLPISIDRWRNPISTLLRACVQYNPDIEFHSFSKPETNEDCILGSEFWQLSNVRKRHPLAIISDQFDIVHTASYSHGNYAASIFAKIRGWGHTRYLDTMNLEQDPSHKVCWARYKRVLRWVDGFIAVSDAVARDIKERVPNRFLGVIPNGVDAELYSDPSDPLEWPESMAGMTPGYPLWIAAIEPRKHPEVLLQLAEKNPELTFVALGQPIGEDGKSMIKEWEKRSNIRWLGGLPRSQAKAILSHAGVLVFPSEREGLSLAMIEAVALGIPIVCQPKSSMPELVQDGVNGSLIDVQNFSGWDYAMKQWMKPGSLEQKSRLEECRLNALQKYDWKSVGKAYGPIYRSLMEQKPSIYKFFA